MAKEIQLPTGNELLDKFMMNIVWKLDSKVRLYDKQSSALMWFLYVAGFMWIWNTGFFKRFHTTIGNKVYIKRDSVLLQDWTGVYKTMRHEFIHILQRRKHWIFYDIAYLFPQVLAVFAIPSLLAILFGLQWLWFLCSLVFLLPLPAYWRMKFEMEAYTQTILVSYEVHGFVSESMVSRIARNFTGPAYYFMWPLKGYVQRRLESIVDGVQRGRIKTPYLNYFY